MATTLTKTVAGKFGGKDHRLDLRLDDDGQMWQLEYQDTTADSPISCGDGPAWRCIGDIKPGVTPGQFASMLVGSGKGWVVVS